MRLDYPNVIPECFVDTNLMQYLLNGTVNHQHCCSKVVGTLKGKFSDRFAVGIIDRDKVELGYVRECDEVAKTKHLTLFKHRSLPHYLMTVEPAIDKFILDNAESVRIKTEEFGIPSDLKGFTVEAKKVTSNKDARFRGLFVAIKDAPEIMTFKKVIKYLLANTYNSNKDDLSEILRDKSCY